MKTWQPWTITNNTLQLTEWPDHGQGVVVVEGDVFAAWEVGVVDLEGDIVCHTLPPGVGSHDTDPWGYGDVLRDLFAHIDAHPATHYVLRTLHPERVREVWPPVPEVGEDDWCDGSGPESCPGCGNCVRYRPNVTLSALIHTQEEADQRLPVLLELADLCREVYPTMRPVERIDLGHLLWSKGELAAANSVGMGWSQPYPRIVVSGGEEPMHPDHVRDLRDQAAAAGVPFVFDGWGDWVPACQLPSDAEIYLAGELADRSDVSFARVGSENSGNTLDGRTWPWELNTPATPGEGN